MILQVPVHVGLIFSIDWYIKCLKLCCGQWRGINPVRFRWNMNFDCWLGSSLACKRQGG